MPNPKRIIPVSEVKPGDSVQIGGDIRFVADARPWHDWTASIVLTCRKPGRRSIWVAIGTPVTVGFTNRKAKRARGKMARRERFDVRSKAALDQFRAGGAEARRVLQAQSDRLASSVSHAEDAAIIRHTRIAGRSPGKT